jgi:hypothetical protein
MDGAQRAPAWGEPARPGFPPWGNGKGDFNSLLPQAIKSPGCRQAFYEM